MTDPLSVVYLVWVTKDPWAACDTPAAALEWWDRMERVYARTNTPATIVVEELDRQTGRITRLSRTELEHRAAHP